MSLIAYPDPITTSRMLSASALLFFDRVTITAPPATQGKEPADLAAIVVKRQPPWAGAFLRIFHLAKQEHAGFKQAIELLAPVSSKITLIMPSFGYDHEGLRWAAELCGTGGTSPTEAFDLIDEEAATAVFFRHLSEYYVEKGQDIEALYAYCSDVFARGMVRSLLAECYFARLNILKTIAFDPLLVTNPKIMKILGRQPVDVPTGPHVDEQRRKGIAWEVFNRLIAEKTELVDARSVDRIARLMQNKKPELERLRQRCTVLSYDVNPSDDEAAITAQIEKVIVTKVNKEIADVFDLDAKSLREFTAGLFSDSKTWLACAGAVSSLLSGHLELTTAAAIAILSKLGAEAFKSAAARKERLRQNDFSLLYFLRR